MEDIMANVINNGFAIAVSAYLLIRMEQKIEQLTLSIFKLDKSINCIAEKKGD